MEILAPTFSRLETVCVRIDSTEVQLTFLRYLGPQCTHLWLRPRGLPQLQLNEWPRVNRQLLTQLTHLNLEGRLRDMEGLNRLLECTTVLQVLHLWLEQNVSFLFIYSSEFGKWIIQDVPKVNSCDPRRF